MPKINELPIEPFTDDKITNCFYVENMNTPIMKVVEMQNIFDWIKKESVKNGLTVKLNNNSIMFITGPEKK